MCYTCLVLGLLWTARRQIIRRETLKNQLRVEQLEKEKAQELDQARSRFFANISHEFRTPLTLIKAPLEDLLTSRKNDEERVLFLGMHQNTERLLELVNQLLDLSKLEAGVLQIQTEPLDIYLLLKQLAGNFQSLASQKQLDFQIEIPAESLPLHVDKDKFEKIILNLLSNAIKFAPEKGWVQLKASYSQYLKISIGNNGKTIPESDLEQIFDRFYQAADTRQQGAGIGLALVQEFVELHGGKVGAKSSPEATWFWVELPLERAKYSTKQEKTEKVDPLYGLELNETMPVKKAPAIADLMAEKPTLLLVEDHAEVRAYIQEKLSPHFKVIGVENGQKGWQQATQLLPDLIISDVMMPVMDGVSLCNKIKSDHRTDHIPIILLTAKADTESRISGLKTGADDYLAKPFNSEELIIRSQNLIEQRRKLQLRFSQNLRQTLASEPANSAEKKFLKKAIALVEANMDNTDFSTSQFAKEMLLSRTQLHRKLKSLTDMSATDFVRNIRLEKAAQLIQQQSGTISEIAYDVGFNNLSYFAKCFKKKYGKAPSNF